MRGGHECRQFKCIAVALHRSPSNVQRDGVHMAVLDCVKVRDCLDRMRYRLKLQTAPRVHCIDFSLLSRDVTVEPVRCSPDGDRDSPEHGLFVGLLSCLVKKRGKRVET